METWFSHLKVEKKGSQPARDMYRDKKKKYNIDRMKRMKRQKKAKRINRRTPKCHTTYMALSYLQQANFSYRIQEARQCAEIQ